MVANSVHREPHADELIAEYVVVAADHDGIEDARLARYGIPVWSLVGYLPAAEGDLGAIAEAYQIPLDAVLAAFAFYARHRDPINARIAANMASSD